MSSVTVFSSIEELVESLKNSREAADARISDAQRAVTVGDYVLRVMSYMGKLVFIYGKILDPLEGEKQYYDLDDPEERLEWDAIQSQYGSGWRRSFCFGEFYSELCPQGELGDIHRSVIAMRLDKVAFELARENGWAAPDAIARLLVEGGSK